MKNYILIGLAVLGISSCAWIDDFGKDIGNDTKGINRTAKVFWNILKYKNFNIFYIFLLTF